MQLLYHGFKDWHGTKDWGMIIIIMIIMIVYSNPQKKTSKFTVLIFDTIDIPDSNDETPELKKASQNKASFLLRPFISSLCFLTSTQQLTSSFLLLFLLQGNLIDI